jgi:hypothetical protein
VPTYPGEEGTMTLIVVITKSTSAALAGRE